MKILQVATLSSTIRAFLLPFANEFKKEGWRVDAAGEGASTNKDVINSHTMCHDIDFVRNPKKIGKLFRCASKIRELVRREEYDIVHVHTPIAAFVTRLSIIGLGAKVIYTAHGFHFIERNPSWKNFVFISLEKLAGLFTDHLIVMNNDDYKKAKKHKIVSSDCLTYSPGIGVSTNKYQYSENKRYELREELNAEDRFLLLHVAELNSNKNHKVVLEALNSLKSKNKLGNLLYCIVGSGKNIDFLRDIVRTYALSEHVVFLGYRTDVVDLLSAADALCLSSYREGLPRCLLEAACVGLPVIASDIRGCRDLLNDGCGVLADPDSSLSWEKGIVEIKDTNSRDSYGKLLNKKVTEFYTIDNVLSITKDVYKKYEI